MNTTAIIIDDQRVNIKFVSNLLKQYCPHIEVLATATNVADGIAVVTKHEPNILFLDIELHDKTGFDLLDAVHIPHMKVILISAYESYAFKAFKYSVVDYLRKPIVIDELQEAVKRAEAGIIMPEMNGKKPVVENYYEEYLQVVHATHVQLLHYSHIVHLESESRYTCIFTTDGKKIVSAKTLKEYEAQLSSKHFIRVHRSHIVNRKYITKYARILCTSLTMIDDAVIPVSLTYRMEVIRMFKLNGK